MKKFVTYLTIYSGDKLPQFYIGSTSYKKFVNGYHGTSTSKKWKKLYEYEIEHNPSLFDSCIINEFDTRKEALEDELKYQKRFDVVKSDIFFNESYAAPNGCFGRDVSGENHPLFGSHNCSGNVHSYHPVTKERAFLDHIPKGYVKGRYIRGDANSHNKGKKWYNNGIEQRLVLIPPEGWVKGKLTSKCSEAAHKMWKRIHEQKHIVPR